ncbi:MAG: flagellar hook capping protein [Sporomusa sp.]|nr:flagellar hook capping protein [Sporomusa sp.]
MSTNPVNNTEWWKNPTNTDNKRNTGNDLDANSFLQLLATEMKYQDPLDPVSNTEFVAQMAQFNSLQRLQDISNSMSSTKAYSLIGKVVSYRTTDASGNQTVEFGTVQTVYTKNGQSYLTVNGKDVSLDDVVEVAEPSTKPIGELLKLIGMNCKGYVQDSKTGDFVSVGGVVKSVRKDGGQDYVVMDDVKAEVDSIQSTDYDSSQDKYEYLQNHVGQDVSLSVKDPVTGKTATIKGKVESVTNENGKLKVVMDGVDVPANLLYSVAQA